MGTCSSAFVDASLFHLQAAARRAGSGVSETAVNSALALIEAAAPKDETDGSLAIWMACTHTAAMAILARLGGYDTERRTAAFAAAASKLLRAYMAQLEAFRRRDFVAGGGLMSYGADILDMFHGVGVYTGKVLQGAKPADIPVQQTTEFEFTINLQTVRALGIEVPSGLLAIADEVIEYSKLAALRESVVGAKCECRDSGVTNDRVARANER